MREAECRECRQIRTNLSETLGVCQDCLRENSSHARELAGTAHFESRRKYDLPKASPRNEGGIKCRICANECVIEEDGRGFCGLRTVQSGRLVHLAGKPRNA